MNLRLADITIRQLLIALVIVGALVVAVIVVIHKRAEVQHQNQVVSCLLHAPLAQEHSCH